MIQDIHFWWQIFLIFVYQNYCRQHDRRQVKLSLMYAHRSICLKTSPKQGGERPCVLGNYYLWPENEPIWIPFLFITGHVLFTREASIYFGKCWEIGKIGTIVENWTKFGNLRKFSKIGEIGGKMKKLANWKNWEKLKLGQIKIGKNLNWDKLKLGKIKIEKNCFFTFKSGRACHLGHVGPPSILARGAGD